MGFVVGTYRAFPHPATPPTAIERSCYVSTVKPTEKVKSGLYFPCRYVRHQQDI